MSDEVAKDIETKVQALDVKGKLIVITTDAAVELSTLRSIREAVKSLGGLGVLYLPDVDNVRAETIDSCIEQLQVMKAQAEASQTRG